MTRAKRCGTAEDCLKSKSKLQVDFSWNDGRELGSAPAGIIPDLLAALDSGINKERPSGICSLNIRRRDLYRHRVSYVPSSPYNLGTEKSRRNSAPHIFTCRTSIHSYISFSLFLRFIILCEAQKKTAVCQELPSNSNFTKKWFEKVENLATFVELHRLGRIKTLRYLIRRILH